MTEEEVIHCTSITEYPEYIREDGKKIMGVAAKLSQPYLTICYSTPGKYLTTFKTVKNCQSDVFIINGNGALAYIINTHDCEGTLYVEITQPNHVVSVLGSEFYPHRTYGNIILCKCGKPAGSFTIGDNALCEECRICI